MHSFNSHFHAVITIAILLRYDYDVSRARASIRRDSTPANNEHVSFRRSRIVVESNAYRNLDHFRRS